jgi:hypothetical protein
MAILLTANLSLDLIKVLSRLQRVRDDIVLSVVEARPNHFAL